MRIFLAESDHQCSVISFIAGTIKKDQLLLKPAITP